MVARISCGGTERRTAEVGGPDVGQPADLGHAPRTPSPRWPRRPALRPLRGRAWPGTRAGGRRWRTRSAALARAAAASSVTQTGQAHRDLRRRAAGIGGRRPDGGDDVRLEGGRTGHPGDRARRPSDRRASAWPVPRAATSTGGRGRIDLERAEGRRAQGLSGEGHLLPLEQGHQDRQVLAHVAGRLARRTGRRRSR